MRIPGAALSEPAPGPGARAAGIALFLLLLSFGPGLDVGPARREAEAAPAGLPSVFEARPGAPAGAARSDPALRARFTAEYRKTAAPNRCRLFAAYIPTLAHAGRGRNPRRDRAGRAQLSRRRPRPGQGRLRPDP